MTTQEQLQHDINFHLDGLKGWLSVNNYEAALIKAEHLVDTLQQIVTAQGDKPINAQDTIQQIQTKCHVNTII